MQYLEFPLRDDGTATLCAYVLDPAIRLQRKKKRPAMLVCPGGAYLTLATKEGEPVAARWMGLGYQSFVVRYKHAREWDIDESRVFCMGFSAGAHLAGSLAERFDDPQLLARAGATAGQARPAGVVMGYPMISARPLLRGADEVPEQMLPTLGMISRGIFGTDAPTPEQVEDIDLRLHVREDMPRVFVWHTTQDVVVDPCDTLAFVAALQAARVPCELHLYERGPHGTSLCDATSAAVEDDVWPDNAAWVEACRRWLELGAPEGDYSHE